MFQVFKFECQYQLRSPLFLVLSVVFFLFAFFLTASEGVSLGGVGNNLNFNASWTIVYTQFFFSIIGMFAAIAIVSQAITRDYEFKTAELFFATGISEKGFLLGRFFGAGLFGLVVGMAALLGTLVATFMPWLDQERIGAFTLAPYMYALLIVTLPNLFFSSALFYALAALTRSMLAAFVGAVGFIVLYIIISNLVDPEKIELLAMFGPFGQVAFDEVSRYWTVFERNVELVPVTGSFLFNRIIWVSIGIVALGLTTWRYRFSLETSTFRRRKKPRVASEVPPLLRPGRVVQQFDWATPWRQFHSQVRIDLAAIYKTIPFYAVLAFALLNVWGSFSLASVGFGAPLLPTTGALLRSISSGYTFFILLIVIYYAGEIVHRERSAGVSDVLDVTPFANGVMVASKIMSLWFIIVCLLGVGMLAAIISQLTDGYTHLEIGLYVQSLFFVQGGYFFLLAIWAVFLQVLLGNKWLGMIATLTTFILFVALPSWDFQHGLYLFSRFSIPYSDMNGYGHYLMPLIAFTLYWSLFCALLSVCAHLFYVRGYVDSLRARIAVARARLNTGVLIATSVLVLAFVGAGSWIFYNTNVLNEYTTTDSIESLQAAYETSYKHYETKPKPEVLSVDSIVDLFPAQRRLESLGRAQIVNQSTVPILDVLVSTHPFAKVNALVIKGAQLIEQNSPYGVQVFRFEPPLAVGAQTTLDWDITWRHIGFANVNETAISAGSNNRVVANGTFVNNTEIMPIIGYNSSGEIGDPNTRRQHGLAPLVRLPKLGDPKWINTSQFGVAQRTEFRTTFSTSADQIAVAPGYQVGDMRELDGRRYYTYEMDEAIWPFFSFLSARYEVARDEYEDVKIEIYYDKQHRYNIEPMVRGAKKSLAYFNREFSPYQYRQFRILEFPRYASFAQSFPNTVPFSESIGFVADLRDEHALDLVFYVTAHEMAHQWWGHQLASANVQGSAILSETLSQYSAMMVMEKKYGEIKLRKFLTYELDRYLRGRSSEILEEMPLMRAENQPYIHYRKGSVIMMALKKKIGEQRLNTALQALLNEYKFRNDLYPTTLDLLRHLNADTSSEEQDYIQKLFAQITIYDLRAKEVSSEELDNGQYKIMLTVSAQQFSADGKGKETEQAFDEQVEVVLFSDDPNDFGTENRETHSLTQQLKSGETVIEMIVDELPKYVGIDPYVRFIDRDTGNNVLKL